MTEKSNPRQYENVSMNSRGFLKIGGIVLPYYPAYEWNGMGSGTTNASTINMGRGKNGRDSSTRDSRKSSNNR